MEKTKPIKDSEVVKLDEFGEPIEPDYSRCSHCGVLLPPNESRHFPELCPKCVWRNDKKNG